MKKFLTLFAAAAALVACNKAEPQVGNAEPQAVRFTVSNLGTYTLKSTDPIDGASPSNVGIYAADLGANNVEATVSGATLTPSSTIYWRVGQTTASTFIARYPYVNGATTTDAYNLPADQHELDTYSYHSNVMSAVASSTPELNAVAFDFKHPFAKVVVNVTNNLSADAVATVVMKNMKLRASEMNLSTAPATITLTEDVDDVNAYKASATSFEMIVMPQAAAANMDIVVTTLLGSVYTFNITNASYTFQPGKVATVAVTLDPIGGGSGAGIAAVGSTTIHEVEEWTSGDATTSGANGTPTLGDYYQVGGCVYSTADKDNKPAYWSKYYNMTYASEHTWTITINYDESMAGDNDSGKGFLIRLGNSYYGMWTGSSYLPNENYALQATDETHSNIKFQNAGNYTITYNSNTHNITWVRNGDAE